MKIKYDEENFDEAESQAYRCWTETTVPSEIASLFQDPNLSSLAPTSPPFFHLLSALHRFTLQPPHTLPLTSALPDMKANTTSYIHLQKLYKARAEEEKAIFKSLLQIPVDDSIVDSFVKNAHALKVLRGKKWGTLDADPIALGSLLLLCSLCTVGLTQAYQQTHSRVTLRKQRPTLRSPRWLFCRLSNPRLNLPLKPLQPRPKHSYRQAQSSPKNFQSQLEKCALSLLTFLVHVITSAPPSVPAPPLPTSQTQPRSSEA